MSQICRYYASTGSCLRGTKCKFVHQRSSDFEIPNSPPDTNTPATTPAISDPSMPQICRFYASTGSCKRGTKCKFVHQCSSESPPDTNAPATDAITSDARKSSNGFCGLNDVNELLMRIAELEEELATVHQARLEAEKEAEEAREAQLEAERGEVEAIHAHQDAEDRADRALQALQASESKLNRAVQAQEAIELKSKEAEKMMNAAETRAKDAEVRAEDATKAQKEAELASRTAVQRELLAIEEVKSARRAQAEGKVNVSPARFAQTLLPTIINPAPTSNADAFLAWKHAQSAAKEQAFTIQRIVSGSTLVTFGPGLEVQSIICGFDNGLVEVKDIPCQATMDEITSLFTAINTWFCVIDVRQYEHSSVIATVAVREGIKQQVADAITGKSVRSQVVTSKALKTMVGYAAPHYHTVVLSAVCLDPEISEPPPSFYYALKCRLSSAPGIMSFQFPSLSDSYRSPTPIIAWFNSKSSARQAHDSLHLQSLTSDHIVLQCDSTRQKSVKHALVVPLEHYGLHEIGKTFPKNGETSVSLEADDLTIQTKSLGYEWFDGGQWFDDAVTKIFVASKLKQHSILIKWDCILRTLTMYTDSEPSMRQVSALLESFTTQSQKAVFYQTIDTYIVKSLVQSKQLEKLSEQVGEDEVSLEVLRSRPVIRYNGGQSFFAVRQLMEDIEINQRTKDETKERCTACCLEVSSSTSIALTCGHQYCVSCLKRSILTAAEHSLPIICPGYNTACNRPIAIPVIQTLFSQSVFQTLVEKIAQSYFRRSDQYRYCITPRCTQVYRRSKEPNYITCSSCNATLCSSCHSKPHSHLSCND